MNPIGCSDCHDSETMNLHISRPALREAFARQGKNIDEATPQEMRSLVCAQCHVEYYFRKSDNYLTFPWDKGVITSYSIHYTKLYDGRFCSWDVLGMLVIGMVYGYG